MSIVYRRCVTKIECSTRWIDGQKIRSNFRFTIVLCLLYVHYRRFSHIIRFPNKVAYYRFSIGKKRNCITRMYDKCNPAPVQIMKETAGGSAMDPRPAMPYLYSSRFCMQLFRSAKPATVIRVAIYECKTNVIWKRPHDWKIIQAESFTESSAGYIRPGFSGCPRS